MKDSLSLIRSRKQQEPVEIPAGIKPRYHHIEGIRAVVFDVYGTLFSSGVGDISLATVDNRDAAMRKTLSENGLTLSPQAASTRFDEIFLSVIEQHQSRRKSEGIDFPEVEIRDVWSDFLTRLDEQSLANVPQDLGIETLAIDYETRVNPTQPMPMLTETLAKLKAFGPLSIVSNAQFYTPLLFESFLDATLDELGFRDGCNVWSYALLEGKPSKALYTVAAERLQKETGFTPDACLYVGNDMRNDIWPAQEIGFKTALFAGDKLSLRLREDHPQCGHIEPDVVITQLDQLLQVIGIEK